MAKRKRPAKDPGQSAQHAEAAPKRKTLGKAGMAATASPWTFPKNSLEDAIKVAQGIEEKHAGRPVSSEVLCQLVGYSNVKDWRFLDLLRSANQYGLVEGSGTKVTVSITAIGSDVVAPSSPRQRQSALLKAFLSVELFKQVYDFYQGKKIPENEFFANTIVRNFGVPKERVETFIDVFRRNLEFLRAFARDPEGEIIVASGAQDVAEQPPSLSTDAGTTVARKQSLGREYIDTCFVLMPFGEWFDRYFEEIYSPACKDAGFEPIRADGLFSSGSVMEQIWDQINRAKVLLAELSGKNANVFYELGLSHAIRKPVVFVTSDLSDVPFDLRHLRVVVYDVREPGWDLKLRQAITTYLRNTKGEPERAIPQPFRSLVRPADPTQE
jgi:hypothetical protein